MPFAHERVCSIGKEDRVYAAVVLRVGVPGGIFGAIVGAADSPPEAEILQILHLVRDDVPEGAACLLYTSSSLAFHYVASFGDICRRVRACLTPGGDFVFSVEHPVFTAYGSQDWWYDGEGRRLHWPVDLSLIHILPLAGPRRRTVDDETEGFPWI